MNQPHPTTPEHRRAILDALEAQWAKVPHQRLGQLLSNAVPNTQCFRTDAELVHHVRTWVLDSGSKTCALMSSDAWYNYFVSGNGVCQSGCDSEPTT